MVGGGRGRRRWCALKRCEGPIWFVEGRRHGNVDDKGIGPYERSPPVLSEGVKGIYFRD